MELFSFALFLQLNLYIKKNCCWHFTCLYSQKCEICRKCDSFDHSWLPWQHGSTLQIDCMGEASDHMVVLRFQFKWKKNGHEHFIADYSDTYEAILWTLYLCNSLIAPLFLTFNNVHIDNDSFIAWTTISCGFFLWVPFQHVVWRNKRWASKHYHWLLSLPALHWANVASKQWSTAQDSCRHILNYKLLIAVERAPALHTYWKWWSPACPSFNEDLLNSGLQCAPPSWLHAIPFR